MLPAESAMELTVIFLIMFMAMLFIFAAVGRRHGARKKDSSSGDSAGTGFWGWGGEDSPCKSDDSGSGQHGHHGHHDGGGHGGHGGGFDGGGGGGHGGH